MLGFYKEHTIKTIHKIIIKKLFIDAADDRILKLWIFVNDNEKCLNINYAKTSIFVQELNIK